MVLTKKDNKPRERQNIPLIIGISVIVAFYIIMFGSRYFMDTGGYKYNLSAQEIDKQTLWVDYWSYDADEKQMEVVISITGSYKTMDYIVSSKVRTTSNTDDVDAAIVAQGTDILVVHLNDIPRLFKEVRLTIETDSGSATFYNNIDLVERVDNIEILPLMSYRIDTRSRQIEINNLHIEELQNSIMDNNELIEYHQATILDIEAQKKYLTAAQIEEATREIHSLEQTIEQTQKENDKLKAQIKEYQDRNANIEQEIRDMKEEENQ